MDLSQPSRTVFSIKQCASFPAIFMPGWVYTSLVINKKIQSRNRSTLDPIEGEYFIDTLLLVETSQMSEWELTNVLWG